MSKTPFWKFVNSADGDSAELTLYGSISEYSWWGDDVTPAQFNADLAALGNVKSIKVRINSPGGDVFAATAIYNSLRNHPAEIITYIDGLAASAASVVAMAGRLVMPATAMMMIHNPATGVWGDARALRNYADILDTVRDSIIPAYEAKTKMSRSELTNMMNAGKDNSGTWMTAKEALEKGFADEIDDQEPVAVTMREGLIISNGLGFDMKKFGLCPLDSFVNLVIPPVTGVDNSSSDSAEQNTKEAIDMADTQVTDVVEEPVAEETVVETTAEETAEVTDAADVVDPVLAERERIKAIRALVESPSKELMPVIDAAIDEGLSVEAASHKILTSAEFKAAQALSARAKDAGAVDGVAVGGGELQSLTEEIIHAMSPEEQDSRRSEIVAFYQAKRASK
jgi:ATP-dependent Clp protease, protease subunit